jgi:putative peptidoglycan lipid II flippase
VATLASRVLGLARDQVLAALFGASNEMDAFIVAFRIPNLLRDLFAEGVMSAAFVPAFTRHLTLHNRQSAWRLGNNVINVLLLVSGTLVVLGIAFARPLVMAYAGDYAAVPGKLELTIRLTRLMLPFLTMVTIAAAVMGMLNSLHYYFLPALSPAMFNIATIVCAIGLVPVMPLLGQPPIMAIAVGALVGGVGQVVIQWPALQREGFRYRFVMEPRDAALREVLVMMGPGTIGLAATQVNLFVNTLVATSQGTGAVSWLSYAFRLMYLPIGVFGVSIATAVLPALSREAALKNVDGMRTTVSRGLALMLMLNVPATFGLVALATPIVRLLFERGRFLPADTASTAAALRLYAVGLVGYSAVRIVSPTFYALRQSRIPVMVSVGTIVLNIVLSVTLVRVMGFRGLALATSIAAMANAATLVWLLRQRLDGLHERRLAVALVKITSAAVVMAGTSMLLEQVMRGIAPGPELWAEAIRLVVAIGGGLLALAAMAKLLRIEEFADAVTMLQTRVQKLLNAG